MRVLTAEEMGNFDRWAIEELGVASSVLMENAALGVVDAIGECFSEVRRVGVLCGPGNNGGDGLAVARLLDARGYECRVVCTAARERMSADAGLQLAICEKLGLPLVEARPEALPDVDLWVDALFGTGLSRPLEGSAAAWAESLNRGATAVVAVDLPSGLDASRARPPGPHVVARLTVTFAAPKVAHVLSPAAEACGELIVVDLGVAFRDVTDSPRLDLLVASELAPWLKERPRDSHKGNFGHLLVIAGCRGMSGAAVLATRAALRSGAGLVTLAVPEIIRPECAAASSESMTVALEGSTGALEAPHLEQLLQAAAERDVVAIGPGSGRRPETAAVLRQLIERLECPLVVDADGLWALGADLEMVTRRQWPTVLTPHPGELASLLDCATAEVARDRLAAVRQAAARSGAVVVLKGHQTLIAEPDGATAINPTGNPGMATGGSGDVLCGAIGSLLAQGYEVAAAAQLGVFLHGLSGDAARDRWGERAMLAGDLVEAWGEAERGLAGTGE